MKWADTCDRLRAQVVGLAANAGCFIFPSVEAALIETAFLLADREREIGGTRNVVAYGHLQDPSLDRMAKLLSATGLDTKPKTESEWHDIATWFGDLKSKTMLAAFCEDDRFVGRVFDTLAARTALFADGVRIPVISLSFSSDFRVALPKPYEIRVSSFAIDEISSVAIVIAGERLRLEPRLASLSVDARALDAVAAKIATLPAASSTAHDLHAAELAKVRHEVEAFEAALPKPFRAWWPKGAARILDRAIITSEAHDGSWVLDQLRPKLLASGVSASLIETGLLTLSGCLTNDERRQEWLRSRGDDAWGIRGGIHISLPLMRALPMAQWTEVLRFS